MCEKFHYDRLRNDRELGNRKSDNNNPNNDKHKNNVGSAWGPIPPGPAKIWKFRANLGQLHDLMASIPGTEQDTVRAA